MIYKYINPNAIDHNVLIVCCESARARYYNTPAQKIIVPSGYKTSYEKLNKGRTLTDAISARFNTTNPDAIIFTPFDIENEAERCYMYILLRSVIVAKVIDPAYKNVPVIVHNENGCYDAVIESHTAYALGGYNRSFIRNYESEGLGRNEKLVISDRVKHIGYNYFDALSYNRINREEAKQIGAELLNFRLINYERLHQPIPDIRHNYNAPKVDIDLCSATVFASASSDKKEDYLKATELGNFLREHEFALCTGGGDKHSMGWVRDGYLDLKFHCMKQMYLIHASTRRLAKNETKHGFMPDCDEPSLYDDIGYRLERLLTSDIIISIGGGDGTGQESAYFYLQQKINRSEFKDKALVFIGEDPSMLKEIESIIGTEKLNILKQNPRGLEKENIFLFPRVKNAKPMLLELKQRWKEKKEYKIYRQAIKSITNKEAPKLSKKPAEIPLRFRPDI
ncbi:MAG: hypothetical protein FWF23_00845 [Alphaproteobacteria bacterium]|nr:hypothetical protein [Alphaproteobacteria bacterium]MCL2505753.1 hypothetical protein [Alphaproteobacteria bacterium]